MWWKCSWRRQLSWMGKLWSFCPEVSSTWSSPFSQTIWSRLFLLEAVQCGVSGLLPTKSPESILVTKFYGFLDNSYWVDVTAITFLRTIMLIIAASIALSTLSSSIETISSISLWMCFDTFCCITSVLILWVSVIELRFALKMAVVFWVSFGSNTLSLFSR